MKMHHGQDPITLKPSTGQQLLELLEWRMRLDSVDMASLVTASRDTVPRAIHGGDGAREAVLQLMHPRGAAMVDMRMRSTSEGRMAHPKKIAIHAGVNATATDHMIILSLETLRNAMRLDLEKRHAVRARWADLAARCEWPWRTVNGARHIHYDPRWRPVWD